GVLRVRPRVRAGHRRARHREPDGRHPVGGDDVAPRRPDRGRRPGGTRSGPRLSGRQDAHRRPGRHRRDERVRRRRARRVPERLMHFGIFLEERRRGLTEAEAFRETLDLVAAADAWGLDGVWLGEIHFNGARSIQSSPLALAAFIAARWRRIRVGTAVQVLPLGNPLRIAEDVATVDQLSEGRFDFGIGRSGSARSYDVLGVPYGESQARFLESLEIIREAWKGRPFSYSGKFYHFKNAAVSPMPYQRPHPPMRMAANSPETFVQVGQLGLPIFVGLRDHDTTTLRTNLDAYRKAWRDAGHAGSADVFLRIPVYAAPSEAEALADPRENLEYFFGRHAELVRSGL